MLEYYKKRLGELTLRLFQDVFLKAKTIGLGTGSTVKHVVDYMVVKHVLNGKILYVSSYDTKHLLLKYGYRSLTPRDGLPEEIDVYIDGFDEVSLKLDMVKGRGGALFWEKQLASRSKIRIYVGDYTKFNNKPYLYLKPIPVEVRVDKVMDVYSVFEKHGFKPRIRTGTGKDGPIITDPGNFIIDIKPGVIRDPRGFNEFIKNIEGVLDTGVFTSDLVDYVLLTGFHSNSVMVVENVQR